MASFSSKDTRVNIMFIVVYLNQSVQTDLIGLHLFLCCLMPLKFAQDVGWVSVRFVFGYLKFLLHPN